ncbi:MAG: hypothetical protein IJZ03_00245 [Clostridia bacterium]|nr:hypothetical protein [Clostridia bacterium]
MKRILAITLTLVMLLVALTGCMAPQISSGPEEDQNPPSKEQGSQSLNPPVPGEIIDLKINSLDELNYYAALRTITSTPKVTKQSVIGSNFEIVLLANGSGQDKEEARPTPDTTGPDVTEGPSVTPDNPGDTDSDEDVYYYELDSNEPFFINKVSMFQIELTDENGFLASKLGLGLVDVVITEECIWGDSLITFRNGEKFFSCLSNGWSLNGETGGWLWDFSTHKYVEGFNIVKNFEQENHAFFIEMNAEGQAIAFECTGTQNGGYHADQNVRIASSTSISDQNSSFTIAELEEYFNDDSVL